MPAAQRTAAPSRVWLACVLLYYPAFWLAHFLVWAAPALVQAALFGYHLEQFRLNLFRPLAVSVPPPSALYGIPVQSHSWDRGPLQPIAAILVLGAAGFLALGGRKKHMIRGFVIATLGGSVGGPLLAQQAFEGRLTIPEVLGFAFYFAILCAGLWWMLRGWPTATENSAWVRRAGILTGASVAIPLVFWIPITYLLHIGFFETSRWKIALLLVAPGTAAAVVMTLLPLRPPAERSQAFGWRDVGWCALAPLLLVTAIWFGESPLNRAFARARVAQNQRAMASYPPVSPGLPYPKLFFQRGVNFTAEWPHPYTSEGARRVLELLPQYGINAIALVPYGWSRRNPPEVVIQRGEEGWESDEGLEELSRVAHARGMKVTLKPAVWDSQNLDFPSAADRARWFAQYGLFLEHYATLARRIHADLFCIGGEFAHLSCYDDEWRKLIVRARELYPGPLVYAANFGAEFEGITFWDALDYIGLQEYYPLPDNLDMDSIVRRVEVIEERYHRPVIFTEVGFASLAGANRRPWDDTGRRRLSVALQASCYESVYRAFYNKPWFEGMYWWKLGTDGSGGASDGSHSPWDKPAMDVLKRWYQQGGR